MSIKAGKRIKPKRESWMNEIERVRFDHELTIVGIKSKSRCTITSRERSERIAWSTAEQHTRTDHHLSWSSCGQRSIGLPRKSVHWLQVRGAVQPFLPSALVVRYSAGRTRTTPVSDVGLQSECCRKISSNISKNKTKLPFCL